MSKTNDLRSLIMSKFSSSWQTEQGVDKVYYEVASDKAMFPHIVYDLDSIQTNNYNRQDYKMIVDVWDKSKSAVNVENIADAVEALFDSVNEPQTHILPTFYLESRRTVLDEDKQIRHKQIVFIVQNYTK